MASGYLDKVVSYLLSLQSRVLAAIGWRGRVRPEVKEIRRMSCNGVEGVLGPCEHREPSARHPGSYFCGACGCGDKRSVLVSGDLPEYEKLDYPHLVCPLGMPGFSNYRLPQRGHTVSGRAAWIEAQSGVEALEAAAAEQVRGYRLQLRIERGVQVLRAPQRILRRLHRRLSGASGH